MLNTLNSPKYNSNVIPNGKGNGGYGNLFLKENSAFSKHKKYGWTKKLFSENRQRGGSTFSDNGTLHEKRAFFVKQFFKNNYSCVTAQHLFRLEKLNLCQDRQRILNKQGRHVKNEAIRTFGCLKFTRKRSAKDQSPSSTNFASGPQATRI